MLSAQCELMESQAVEGQPLNAAASGDCRAIWLGR